MRSNGRDLRAGGKAPSPPAPLPVAGEGSKFTLYPGGRGQGGGIVLLLDTMGELAGTYAVGDINFVGGSWAEVGGHNILEPASFGKPVFFGPVMHNFRDISRILKDCGAGIEVKDGEELATEAAKLLRDPARYAALGQGGARSDREKQRRAGRRI